MTTERPAGLREAARNAYRTWIEGQDRADDDGFLTAEDWEALVHAMDALDTAAEEEEAIAGGRAALAAPDEPVGLDVARLARAIEVVSEGRPEYIVTGAELAIYWTNEMVAKHIAAEYARLREDMRRSRP